MPFGWDTMDSQPNAMKRKRDQSPSDEIEGSNAPKKLSTSDMRQPLGPDSGGTMNPVGGQAASSPGTIPASPRQQLSKNGKKKLETILETFESLVRQNSEQPSTAILQSFEAVIVPLLQKIKDSEKETKIWKWKFNDNEETIDAMLAVGLERR